MTLGFDMKNTIAWYEQNKEELLARLPQATNQPFGFRTRNREQIQLPTSELAALLHLFPEQARERSLLKYIIGKPETWFHSDSTDSNPVPTTNLEEAISPTAIIPSFHEVTRKGWPDYTNIWLYQISPEACSEDVKKIILTEGFVHELAHTINAPALYFQNYNLKLPDGTVVDAFQYVHQFANLAENHSPISHYSSTYRTADNKFNPENLLTAINEELAETVAAYLLNFAFCDDSRGMNPFADRPEVKEWTDNFLNAKLVK
ncbi:hypothetical protein HOA91_05295 [Candidatus Woesearchaeota archaeon]|jgi:hypothetical protein|nr:hypothetical protein [Candidatus Woesearchaeota archaeon]